MGNSKWGQGWPSSLRIDLCTALKIPAVVLGLIWSCFAQAQVLAPFATEVNFTVDAEVSSSTISRPEDIANQQFKHVFGYFSSPYWIRHYDLADGMGGIASIQYPLNIKIKKVTRSTVEGRRFVEVKYKASGKILVENSIAKKWLRAGELNIELPRIVDDFNHSDATRLNKEDAFYSAKCTSPHYLDRAEFWYFYDPFRDGCYQFRTEPLARGYTLRIRPAAQANPNLSPDLDVIRGDNGNGDVFYLTIFNGFYESNVKSSDEGRRAYRKLNQTLKRMGFLETSLSLHADRPANRLEKWVNVRGKNRLIRIDHFLSETSMSESVITFAKRFQKALYESDVLIYSGHSGLGGNLDIASLNRKLQENGHPKIKFNQSKKQIFFFDSCSSYSYYLDQFRGKKAAGKIDILTNGLSSYFDTQTVIQREFITQLIDFENQPTWMSLLTEMEAPLKGSSYLLNVGAL